MQVVDFFLIQLYCFIINTRLFNDIFGDGPAARTYLQQLQRAAFRYMRHYLRAYVFVMQKMLPQAFF